MRALGATVALLLGAGVASAQVGPPISPGAPPDNPYPGQPYPVDPRYPGVPPVIKGQPPDIPAPSLPELHPKASEELTGRVVGVDAKARTITIRERGVSMETTDTGNAPAERTLPVRSHATHSLKKLREGDDVRLTCRPDDSGRLVVDKIDRVAAEPVDEVPVSD